MTLADGQPTTTPDDPGVVVTGEVHLNPDAVLSAFIESPSPAWIPMTDVRTRSLADRRTSRAAPSR